MRWFSAFAILLAACCGCDKSPAPGGNSASSSNPTNSAAPETTATESTNPATASSTASGKSGGLINEVEISLADFAKLEAAVQSFNGRVVVLDVWSTSCLPCMKEFPHLVELARRWPEDVVCISLNLDYSGLPNMPAKDCIPKAKEFLVSVSADATNLMNLVSSEPDETVYTKFKIEGLPAIMIYDRQGNLTKKVTVETSGENGLTYAEDVLPMVEQLIESK